MLYASNFTTQLLDELSEQSRSQALIRSEFLFPTSDISTLLQNTSFTDSLQCINTTQNGYVLSNESMSDGCGSVESIFHSWPNFYTCSWYPSLAQEFKETSVNSTELTILTKLGVPQGQDSLSANVSSSVANCLSDYCQSSSTCILLDQQNSCSLNNLLISNGSSQTLNRTNAFACLRDNVCATTTEVNPDIGGLGVLISLLVQHCISLLALVLHGTLYLTYRLIRTHPQPYTPLNPSPAHKTYTHHLSTLTSALTEFQKSQCFFASTLSIASLILLFTFSTGLHSKDKILLRLTSGNAFAPITLSLSHLQLLQPHPQGKNSMYILLLSTLTFALGSAAYWFSFPRYGGGFEYDLYEAPEVAVLSCGNVAPFAPCFVRNQFYLFEFRGWTGDRGIVYKGMGEKTGLVVWVLSGGVLVYRIFAAFREKGYVLGPGAREVYDRMAKDVQEVRVRVARLKAPRFLRGVLDRESVVTTRAALKRGLKGLLIFLGKGRSWLYIQLFLGTAALLMQLVSAIQVVVLSANIIAKEMGFGQIVAVGIWIPVLLEYAYLEIAGAYKGTKDTLEAPLVVSNELPDDTDSEPKTSSIEDVLPQRRRFPTI